MNHAIIKWSSRKLTQTDKYQEISDSRYNSANSLIYLQTLLEYLNSSYIHMPKTCAHAKQVLGQPELRVSVQMTCKSICMPSGKSALSDLQERRTQAAFLAPKPSTFPSSGAQSRGLVFDPGNFSRHVLSQTSPTFCCLCNWLPHTYFTVVAKNQRDTPSSQKGQGQMESEELNHWRFAIATTNLVV